jgi:membrane associated rhomboid family serine protease
VRNVLHLLLLPWRLFSDFWRAVFARPFRSLAIFATLGVAFVLASTLTTMPDVAPVAGAEGHAMPHPVALFPAAGAFAAFCGLVCGALLIWAAERRPAAAAPATSAELETQPAAG